VPQIGAVLSDPSDIFRIRKLGDSQMIIKNCKVCGADIKLKRELRINIALSCYPCLKKEAVNYQLNNPSSVGYLDRVLTNMKAGN
jgi:hypothetical protein